VTAKALVAINRKTRIVKLVLQGLPYNEIAAQENCSLQWVSVVALGNGLRKQNRHGAAANLRFIGSEAFRGQA
jgi:uncharacterized protein YerC